MKKKITLIVIAVLLVISLVVGISYAYWKTTYQATNINKIVSSCFSMEITNEKNNIILDDAYPITDEKGKALTPYSFTITNTCDLFASYTINLEMLEGTTLNSKYIKTMINSEAITNLSTLEATDPSIEGAIESRILFRGSLGSGDSIDYTFRVWMDYDTPNNEESMNKSFQGKITVTAEVSTYSPVENGFTNLAEALLVNEYQTTSLDVAKNKIASKQKVDFTKTAPIIIWNETISQSSQNYSLTKAESSQIGSYGITEKATKVLFGTSYTLDSSTGYYTILNTSYYDPNNLDYSNNYYFCGNNFVATNNNTISNSDFATCTTIYKVKKLSSITEEKMTLSSGDNIDINKYNFEVYKYYGTELESDKSDKGLYEAQDDHGITYYYRGMVNNNYITFAGFSWRVIRINGDGSIRLLYSGKTNGDNSDITITSQALNIQRTDPTYVGYMYSNILQTSYKDTISNDNDSTLKITLDNWYKTNIEDKGYSNYIADSGFCNDRSIASDSPGDGFSNSAITYYSSRYRILNYQPSFICMNESNDLFTLAENTKGNKKLTYPIGLITADEVSYSGLAYQNLNKKNYLYPTKGLSTLSPIMFNTDNSMAYLWAIGSDGSLYGNYVSNNNGIRPVINLKADTEITDGIGTENDPFIVK